MPLISIIVPMYNVEKYIERCLDSLLNQTYQNLEIICVDDGSPDKSGEIAEEYAAKDKRVVVIHKDNQGLGMARNTGLDNAKGEFVVFVDSDDFLQLDLLENLVLAANGNCADTVIAGYSRYKEGEVVPVSNPIADQVFQGENILNNVLFKMIGPKRDGTDTLNMAVWRVLFSLKIINKNNIRFPSEREFISEDIIFDLKYYSACKCVCGINNMGYLYCLNAGSLTEKYNPDRFIMGKKLFFEKKRILEEYGAYTETQNRVEESFLNYTRYSIKAEIKYSQVTGKKNVLDNVRSIICDDTLRKIVSERRGPHKNILDTIIDFGIKTNSAKLICILLTLIYKVHRVQGA